MPQGRKEITASARGPAKLMRKAYVAQMIDGEIPIGGRTTEFEVSPTRIVISG